MTLALSNFSWQEFRDWHLALAVLCLVVIDILILGLYMLVEGVRGQLGVEKIINRANSESITGVSGIFTRLIISSVVTCYIPTLIYFTCSSRAVSGGH